MNSKKKILESLKRIMTSGGDLNFVTIRDKRSGRYVQFTASKGDTHVLLDIPIDQVEQEKFGAIEDLLGVKLNKETDSFQKEVSAEQGVSLVFEIFNKIFGLQDPEFEIKITLS